MQALALDSLWWITNTWVLWGAVCPGAPDYTGRLLGLSHLDQVQPILFLCTVPCTVLPAPISQHLHSL